jgi:hypothetical protein
MNNGFCLFFLLLVTQYHRLGKLFLKRDLFWLLVLVQVWGVIASDILLTESLGVSSRGNKPYSNHRKYLRQWAFRDSPGCKRSGEVRVRPFSFSLHTYITEAGRWSEFCCDTSRKPPCLSFPCARDGETLLILSALSSSVSPSWVR